LQRLLTPQHVDVVANNQCRLRLGGELRQPHANDECGNHTDPNSLNGTGQSPAGSAEKRLVIGHFPPRQNSDRLAVAYLLNVF
jgi:hypothetical protein